MLDKIAERAEALVLAMAAETKANDAVLIADDRLRRFPNEAREQALLAAKAKHREARKERDAAIAALDEAGLDLARYYSAKHGIDTAET